MPIRLKRWIDIAIIHLGRKFAQVAGHGGQTLSQPYVVALMTEALELEGCEKVLEIGTGTGYQTAVLAALAQEVFTI